MKGKIICILVISLLITTTSPAISVKIKKLVNENPPPIQNGAIDQEQTTNSGYGMIISTPLMMAQSFMPSIENLTAVQLWLFKFGSPPNGVEITVSIRKEKNGPDLTTKTINANTAGITDSPTWVWFDFDDITVMPEETYYITCYASGGGLTKNCYCWLFNINSTYDRGKAWYSKDNGVTWITLWEWSGFDPEWEESDFCFKTYFKQSRDKSINTPLQQFFQNHPYLFPLLKKLLQLLGFGL